MMIADYEPAALERFVDEPSKSSASGRSPFVRDRDRVLHSVGFRRLAGKTQVNEPGRDGFTRTRLTHSLECAQIARDIAREVGADPDLAETAGLAHDLGHPPFGHNGEAVLDSFMTDDGGFEGNAQTFRIVTRLEPKVLDPAGNSRGLNLTRATLEAIVKYPWPRPESGGKFGYYTADREVFDWMRSDVPAEVRPIEAQIMDFADDVAYSVHDLEDGIYGRRIDPVWFADPGVRADIVAVAVREYCGPESDAPDPVDLREAFAGLVSQPWWLGSYDGTFAGDVALKAMTSELIGRFVASAVDATLAGAGGLPVRRYEADLTVPPRTRNEVMVLKAVAAHLVMFQPDALRHRSRQQQVLAGLVEAVSEGAPATLVEPYRSAWEAADGAEAARVIIDQVASLTDASAYAWHDRLLGSH